MTTMNAETIRTQGRLIKAWEVSDGAWYTNKYQIWKVGDKFYQIKDHVGNSFSCTCSYYGKVTVVDPIPEPTHICVIIGQEEGEAYIAQQASGTLEELAEWATEYIKKHNTLYRSYSRNLDQHLVAKFIPLQIEL